MSEDDKVTGQYLELYKLAVEMADRVSARRATANAFFLTINTALLAFTSSNLDDALWLMALAGIALSATWTVLLKSYRDLNAAKYQVIIEMEHNLDAKVFDDEWKRLKEKRTQGWLGRYAEFGAVERFVPLIFAALYAAVFLLEML
jgi:nitrate/nitrite transporter NarK